MTPDQLAAAAYVLFMFAGTLGLLVVMAWIFEALGFEQDLD